MFPVEHPSHLAFLNDEPGRGRDRSGSHRANGLPPKAPFTQEITPSKYPYNGFLAALIDDGKPHAACLNVHDMLRGSTLGENNFLRTEVADLLAQASRVEKQPHIERGIPGFTSLARKWRWCRDTSD